jgi:hypothetical protein
MRHDIVAILILLTFGAAATRGQGTFIYDQQSAIESTGGGGAVTIQTHLPLGQSFTPGLSSVGFVRLFLSDRAINSAGATMYVNVRSDSITGPVLASTEPVFMSDGFVGYPDFFFASPVSVTPGQTYYFEPIVSSGDTWAIVNYNYQYSGGTVYQFGAPIADLDLWFREGIIVPEPSSAMLFLVGGGMFVFLRRRRDTSRT